MRQAMRKVREEHGSDAVILSSRNVEGGVEVISAIDFDEEAVRAAAETTPDFGRTLAQAEARRPAPARGRFSVMVDDDPDDFPAPAPAAAPRPSAPVAPPATRPRPASPRIEWTQDPAMQAMREELRTLRTLFENQLTQMEWQQLGERHPVRATLLRQLHEMGFGADVCRKLADGVREPRDPERALAQALRVVAHNLPVMADDIVERGGVVAMVGATGVGKTTTVAKLAARFALRHGRRHVALVTTDNFRIGGQDQLRSFARILDVPVYCAADAAELGDVLADLADRQLVLIDTAGMSQRDMRLGEQLRTLQGCGRTIQPYLVLSANTQLSALMEMLKQFRQIQPVGCIVSKLDEATGLGPILTAVLRSRLAIAYVADGQRVPEDLSPARGERLTEQARALAERFAVTEHDETLAAALAGGGR
jgi:flagellar biosynthesis protein FlhF